MNNFVEDLQRKYEEESNVAINIQNELSNVTVEVDVENLFINETSITIECGIATITINKIIPDDYDEELGYYFELNNNAVYILL